MKGLVVEFEYFASIVLKLEKSYMYIVSYNIE